LEFIEIFRGDMEYNNPTFSMPKSMKFLFFL